jgi:uncharacterized protein (TIGR03382 family)
MRTRTALPFVLLLGCIAPDDDVTTVDQAIVGGQTATTTDFPTVVGIQRNGETICTGVLVDKDYVLSAASCFDNTSNVTLRIGDSNLTDGTAQGLTLTAATIYKHPQFSYSDAVWRHDIAVVKLSQAVTTVPPTAIRRDATALGAQITQAGFGANNNNGNGEGVLRSLATTNIDCGQAGDSGITNANLLCFNAGDGNGGCFGDGGSPSFVAGTGGARIVVGVGSGGTGSSCTSGLDIHTSLVPELGFIDQYVPVPQGTQPTPPPPPPTDTPPSNPEAPGGSGPGRDPGAGSAGDGDGRGAVRAVSCNAGGDAGGVTALGLAIAAVLRRRRRPR